MEKITSIQSRFGYIDIFTNEDKSLLYAEPNGYVDPSLVKKDLQFLEHFDNSTSTHWTYIINISKVKIVHPLNPFLLNRIKKFSNLNEYIVYAPSPIVRVMLHLTSWINQPDKILKNQKALQLELAKYTPLN